MGILSCRFYYRKDICVSDLGGGRRLFSGGLVLGRAYYRNFTVYENTFRNELDIPLKRCSQMARSPTYCITLKAMLKYRSSSFYKLAFDKILENKNICFAPCSIDYIKETREILESA